jgi:hypothetical protein
VGKLDSKNLGKMYRTLIRSGCDAPSVFASSCLHPYAPPSLVFNGVAVALSQAIRVLSRSTQSQYH